MPKTYREQALAVRLSSDAWWAEHMELGAECFGSRTRFRAELREMAKAAGTRQRYCCGRGITAMELEQSCIYRDLEVWQDEDGNDRYRHGCYERVVGACCACLCGGDDA